jgi:hypothetical protein
VTTRPCFGFRPAIVRPAEFSKYVLETELQLTSIAVSVWTRNCGVDASEIARRLQTRIGWLKVRMIEYIERIGAEL